MRLYKYLLITDEIINNPYFFKESVFTKEYQHHKTNKKDIKKAEVVVEYKNKFYTYLNDENIVFMSFDYPNYSQYKKAYAIIDKEDIDKIRASIIKHKTKWSANHDTENKQENLEASLNQIKLFRDAGVLDDNDIPPGKVFDDESWIIKSKFRTGGYINQGNINKYKLHHFLFGVSGDSTKHYIHHRGHTFDNRKNLISDILILKHDDIHKTQEPTKDIYRGKHIMRGNFYDTALDCNCKFYKDKSTTPECDDYCPGTLLIENIDSFNKFMGIIDSSDYLNMPK
ncbi:hypothetical protein [Clostridium sp.]|uniref:hypothetical protein n=1 Tax=Clostridium sp. TaxID=1506 RepID=UPI001A53AAAF|nr:hypothetical protein [Clostridium sp.]MBK5241110.1 hypothetical protein [Clostridium sp.]